MAVLPTLPAFTADALMYIAVESGESRTALRMVDGQWSSTNKNALDRIEEITTTLSSLQVSRCFDFLPSQQALSLTGFSSPTATITVEYLNSVGVESSFSMTLGDLRSAEEGYYVTFNDEADAILRDEFDKNGLADKVWQYFIAVPEFKSVGVKDGKRYDGWTAIIRAVNTTDAMTATIEEIPYPLLHTICDRITHEVEGINRVFMDITPKPIGTIEFE